MPEYRVTIYSPGGRLDYQLLWSALDEDEAGLRARELAKGRRFTVDCPRKLHCNGDLTD